MGNEGRGLPLGHLQVIAHHDIKAALIANVKILTLDGGEASLIHELVSEQLLSCRDATMGKSQQCESGYSGEGVAGVYCLRLSPDAPHRWAVAPFPVVVLDIIVDQGKVVHQLHPHRRRQRLVPASAHRLAGKQA